MSKSKHAKGVDKRKPNEICDYCYHNRIAGLNFRRENGAGKSDYRQMDNDIHDCICDQIGECLDPFCKYSAKPAKT